MLWGAAAHLNLAKSHHHLHGEVRIRTGCVYVTGKSSSYKASYLLLSRFMKKNHRKMATIMDKIDDPVEAVVSGLTEVITLKSTYFFEQLLATAASM